MPSKFYSPTPTVLFRRVRTSADERANRELRKRVKLAVKAAKKVSPVVTGRFKRSIRSYLRPYPQNTNWKAWTIRSSVIYAPFVLERHTQIRRAIRRVLG